MNTKPSAPVPTTPDDYIVPEPEYPTFAPGTRVRDIHSRPWVVSAQNGCQVWVEGYSGWFHPTKVLVAD